MMTRTPLGPGAEFDLIRRILADAGADDPRVELGSGDDCALLAAGDEYLAVGVDLCVEGVHFRSDWGEPERVGDRAVRAALSDLAAMAAAPLGVLVAISLPGDRDPELGARLGAGCRSAVAEVGTSLVGGDLSYGGVGLVLDVTVLGSVRAPLLRRAVRAGDELWVTGQLGAAAAAVRSWTEGAEPVEEWRDRFWRPTPRLHEARWLAERGASAGIDLSDGLVADAAHLSAASGVAIEIDFAAVPAAEGVPGGVAMAGGDDYELLVAVARGILDDDAAAEFTETFGITLTRVGRAVVGEGVRVFRDGEEVEVASPGYDHLA